MTKTTGLYKAAEELRKSGSYAITGNKAAKIIDDAAEYLGIKLQEVIEEDMERARKILARGTPLSYLIREMRET